VTHRTDEILENAALLIHFLDDAALVKVADLPFLEMAKDVSITPLSFPQNRKERMGFRVHKTRPAAVVSKKQQLPAAPATHLRVA
jgi:hypothetical protein